MSRPLSRRLPTLALCALAVAASLAGCSNRPFEVTEPGEAWDAVRPYQTDATQRSVHDYNPDPRPISLCYSAQINTQEEVLERAKSLCPYQGKLVYFDEDSFINGCALFQPYRVTFLCTPGPRPESPYE